MQKGDKPKKEAKSIKVEATNRPNKEQSKLIMQELGEFLSRNWYTKRS